MPDYSKAKIYKIYPLVEGADEGDEYFGSTCVSLSRRMGKHRTTYKTGNGDCSSKILFEKYGVENCVIELIEEYPCENKEQLNKREGEFIKNNKCVNKYVAGRSCKEYYEDNKDKLGENKKLYYNENKNKLCEQKKLYYEANKNKINEHTKLYYNENKNKLCEQKKLYYEANKNKIREYQKLYQAKKKLVEEV